MPVIDSKYVEIEIQEQTMPGAARHYCISVKFEPTDHKSLEIQSILLSDFEPLIKWTRDNGRTVTQIGEEKIAELSPEKKDIASLENDVRLYQVEVDQLKQEITELKNVKNN